MFTATAADRTACAPWTKAAIGLLLLLGLRPAWASEPAVNAQTFAAMMNEVGDRIASGVRADLRGPCRALPEVQAVLSDWTPPGRQGNQVLAKAMSKRGLSPQEVAAYFMNHPAEAADAIVGSVPLEPVLRRYARRCDLPELTAIHGPAEPDPGPPPGPAWTSGPTGATPDGKPALVWVRAAWAVACTEMEDRTWSDPRVIQAVNACFVPVRIDMTEDNPATTAWLEEHGVRGIPATLVLDANGAVLEGGSLVGFQDPDPLLRWLSPFCPVAAGL